MNPKLTKIFVVTGKSGAGKDSLVNAFMLPINMGMKTDPVVKKMVPYTTRAARDMDEINHKIYHFVSDEEMDNLMKGDGFHEERGYDIVENGKSKHVRYANIINRLEEGARYILVGQFDTFRELCNYYGNNDYVEINLILVDCPKGLRLQRMLSREKHGQKPNYEELCRRFTADEQLPAFNIVQVSQLCQSYDLPPGYKIHYISNDGEFIDCYEAFAKVILGG